jgi:16S rRNA (cytosine1402-N4)-methyltransferase
MDFKHKSVLLEECIKGLNIKEDGIYVDGTLGGAGHSKEICSNLSDKGLLIGIDQDEKAIEVSSNRLEEYQDRIEIVRDNYASYKYILDKLKIDKVNGVLLDLGVSSYQLDNGERGFSYMKDAPLDMRMDQRQEKTAKDIVNNYSNKELFNMIKHYGEEKFASSIVKNIIKEREIKEIETTLDLVNIIDKSIPTKFKVTGGHPAKRTFQAIRIELNKELDVLKNTINDMINSLDEGGRLCIITFHSLEDRIVKHMFRENENPCTCPRDFPVCVCNKKPKGKIITRKPILPTKDEMEQNSRAKSAKLRIFERRGVLCEEE